MEIILIIALAAFAHQIYKGWSRVPEEKKKTLAAQANRKRTHTDPAAFTDTVVKFGGMKIADNYIAYEGKRYPRAGAKAVMDTGAAAQKRMTATRVVGGAVILGPLGAVLGGLAKKRTGMIFLTVDLPDGTCLVAGDKAKHQKDAAQAMQKINSQPKS